MAIENLTSSADFTQVLSSIPGISTVIRLSKIAIIVVIVYISFLIIRGIVQIKYAFSMKKLIGNVEQINQKMDLLVGKGKKKEK